MTEAADLEVVFERAHLARVSGFDLLGEDGMKALCEEVAADFPYLTVADLNATVKLGIKGKLDTYKNRPLNFTRVYQWVEQRAPCSLGYWRHQFPEIMRWAELCKVLDTLLPELQAQYAKFGGNEIDFTVTEHIGQARYPYHHKAQKNPDPAVLESGVFGERNLWI